MDISQFAGNFQINCIKHVSCKFSVKAVLKIAERGASELVLHKCVL